RCSPTSACSPRSCSIWPARPSAGKSPASISWICARSRLPISCAPCRTPRTDRSRPSAVRGGPDDGGNPWSAAIIPRGPWGVAPRAAGGRAAGRGLRAQAAGRPRSRLRSGRGDRRARRRPGCWTRDRAARCRGRPRPCRRRDRSPRHRRRRAGAPARAGGRREDVDAARARVAAAEAQIATSEKAIADATVSSPLSGVVTEKLADAGELLQPRTPLVIVTDLDHSWANVYVDEPIVPRLRLGQAATVFTDAGGPGIAGTVSYIASKAEFTPRNVQTADDRSKLVYRVKVSVDNASGVLKPGMPVEAEIPFRNGRGTVPGTDAG